jgi:hypothetical protein
VTGDDQSCMGLLQSPTSRLLLYKCVWVWSPTPSRRFKCLLILYPGLNRDFRPVTGG